MANPAKNICTALDSIATHFPSRRALIASSCRFLPIPEDDDSNDVFETHKKSLTYGELQRTTNALASWLALYGLERKDVLVSDLPNGTENLMLQVACNRLGVSYATPKNLNLMSKFPKVAVSTTGTGFLADAILPLPYLSGEFLADLLNDSESSSLDGFMDTDEHLGDHDDSIHAFYGTVTSPYTNSQAIQQGKDAAEAVLMTPEDVVCLTTTLHHAFGIGSAVTSTFLSGATLLLPSPQSSALQAYKAMQSEESTLLFTDSHVLQALQDLKPDSYSLKIRGGICKTASGSTIMTDKTKKFAFANLATMGGGE